MGNYSEKDSKFPKSLFVYNAWPVIGQILGRELDDMWNDATPVDIGTISGTSNEDMKATKEMGVEKGE